MPDPSALYPQPVAPPQPSSSLMSDSLRALSALGQINSLLEFSGKRAAAGAVQNAINPDGSIDRQRLMEGLKNSPIMTPGAMTDALTAHNALIHNDTAQFEQWAAQTDYARQNFVSRLNQKTPITADEVLNDAVSMSRQADPRAVPSSVLGSMVSSILRDPAGVNQAYRNMGARVMGPATAMQPVEGPPGAGGQPTKQPLIQAGQASPPDLPAMSGTGTRAPSSPASSPYSTGLSPAAGPSLVGAGQRADDLLRSATANIDVRQNLANLRSYSKIMGGDVSGITADVETKINQTLSRLGLSGTWNKEQLAAAEGFNKIINNLTTAQAGRVGAETDAGRRMILGGTPSLTMSQFGREGMIDMATGNLDYQDAMRREWLKRLKASADPRNEAANYDIWADTFASVHDPRIFQFNRLDAEHQRTLYQQLAAEGQVNNEGTGSWNLEYEDAVRRGWVKAPKKQ